MRKAAADLLLLAAALPAAAYVRSNGNGHFLQWPNPGQIQMYIDPAVKGGWKNADGKVMVIPGSDVAGAIQKALDAWNQVSSSRARFAALGFSSAGPRGDTTNVISFADTPSARSTVGDRIAVTLTWYQPQTGDIAGADIVFNPDMTFSSELAREAFDVQSVATHELGHVLGAGHVPLPSSVMYAYINPEDSMDRELSADDVAYAAAAYPTQDASVGRIEGKVQCDGKPCAPGPSIFAVDPETGAVIHCDALTPDGDYSMAGVPAGNYYVFAQPFATGDLFNAAPANWGAMLYGGNANPMRITVNASGSSRADLAGPAGPANIRLSFGYSALEFAGAIPSGRSATFGIYGSGMGAQVRPEDVLLLGRGLSAKADSVSSRQYSEDGSGSLSFLLSIEPVSSRSAAIIGVRRGDEVSFLTSYSVIPQKPMLRPSDVTNALSFIAAPVAPGELVVASGLFLGPQTGLSHGIETVSVTLDDVAAPLLYAQDRKLRFQVPFEVAGRELVTLRVKSDGLETAPIRLEVADSAPGLSSLVLNEDGTINSYVSPAAPGSLIEIMGTGQGVLDPALATGQLTALAPAHPVSGIRVRLGDQEWPPDTAEMVPGTLGLFRAWIRLPASVWSDNAIPLTLTVRDGSTAAPVSLWIR